MVKVQPLMRNSSFVNTSCLTFGDHYVLPSHLSDDSLSSIEVDPSSTSGFKYGENHNSFFGTASDKISSNNVVIRPLRQEETPPELVGLHVSATDSVRVIPKVHYFHFRFFQTLNIESLEFDGSDLLIWRDCDNENGLDCPSGFLDKPERVCHDQNLWDKNRGCQLCQHYPQMTHEDVDIPAQRCPFYDTNSPTQTPDSQFSDRYNSFLPLFILDATLGDSSLPSNFRVDSPENELLLKQTNRSSVLPKLILNQVKISNWFHQPTSIINLKTNGEINLVNVEMHKITTKYGIITSSFSSLALGGQLSSPMKQSIFEGDHDYWTLHGAAARTMTLSEQEKNQFSCLAQECRSKIDISSSNFSEINTLSRYSTNSESQVSFDVNSGILRLVDYFGSQDFEKLNGGGAFFIEGIITSLIVKNSNFNDNFGHLGAVFSVFQNSKSLTSVLHPGFAVSKDAPNLS
eukprot:CAMPEP_0115021944 /NCGR_PEP_ID=MMETSP0216-20121206/31214_1 /TAXON_ID=223996 /ORGANISM="Protocruzia adherens, Strain Boccale" /LENGTH=459 /DNA_ID=CAMNT_0002394449 /DNA_START=1047 /DNA_END=2423 /DNA_ORIENTATION=+